MTRLMYPSPPRIAPPRIAPSRIARIESAADMLMFAALFVWPLAIVSLILGARLVELGETKSGLLTMAVSTVLLAVGVALLLVVVA